MSETGTFGKDQWVELFGEIGLDEATMRRWHVEFERRWPETHADFLRWLKLAPADVDRIREASRDAWA